MTDLPRRAALAAFPVTALALAAPTGEELNSNDPDGPLRAAWQRNIEARDMLDLIAVN